MRNREAHIPVVLWVSAALLLHLGGGEQADKLATVHDNTSRLRVAARSLADPPVISHITITPGSVQLNPKQTQLLRATASYTDGATTDVTTRCTWSSSDPDVATVGTKSTWTALPGFALVLGKLPGQIVGIKPGAATVSCTWEGNTGSASIAVGELVEIDLQNEEKPDDKPEVTQDKKEPKKEKAPEVKPPPPKKEEVIVAETPPLPEMKEEEAPPPPPPPPQDEKKIAVQQHQDQNESENPEAHYLAEKNHKVKPGEETQANITSTTENDKDPNPGTHQGPPSEKPGNSDKTKVAQDDDRKGAKVAPNVIPKGAVPQPVIKPAPEPPVKAGEQKGDNKPQGTPTPQTNPKPAPEAKPDGKGITAPPPSPNPPQPSDNGPNPAPTVMPAPAPSAIASAAAPPGPGNAKPKGLPNLPTSPGGPKWVKGLGFGAKGDGGKPSISIDEKVAKGAVGQDELDRLKKVEAETKLSVHRGAWKSSSLEKWRAAIENYVPGVKPGNQTNLGTAAVPWATYLAQIHVRLHPIFADTFVEGLGDLPAGHPLNDKSLVTRMEIVMRADGTIHHLGIVKPSGVTAFDLAALDSVDRAGPFGKAPDAIVSPDGLVYLHWEFHRDDMRCSNVNAYPYVLKEGQTPKAPDPKQPPPPPKGNPEEKKAPGQLGSIKSQSPHG
ncbi:MAG: TonB C-terminal domain-containing protein [Polyangiales bacterium]